MKVNDYVRTKYGIAKIIKIDEEVNAIQIDKTLDDFTFVLNEDINKTSSNIIDLIEIGDLVKIEYYSPRYHTRLTRLFEVEYKDDDWIRFCNSHCDLPIFHNQWSDKKMKPVIKSIVTKEQFERCEYKI